MSSTVSSPRGAAGSLSSLLSQNRRLKEENEALADELAQCQVDKDFVWSLWKKLQVESPNITEAVALVIERERQKAEVKDRKVLEILRLKDARIEEIQKEMAQQSKELGLAVQRKLELQCSVEKLQAEKVTVDARLATAAVQLDELRAAAAQRSGDAEEAERQRRSRSELADRALQLQTECDVLRSDRDRLTSLLGEKDRLLAEQHTEATKWAGAHRTLQDKHQASAVELQACKKRVKKAEHCLREHVATLESTRSELAGLQKEHARCSTAAREQQTVVKQMQALQQETEKVLRESESAHLQERASLQALYSNLNRQFSDLKVVEGHLRRTVEELQTRLQRSDSEASFLRNQLQIALREKERQRAVAAQVNFPIDQEVQTKYEPDLEVRLKIEGLEDQLKILREKVNDKNRKIDRLSQEKSELEEQHANVGPRRATSGARHVRSASEGAAGRHMSSCGAGVTISDGQDLSKRLALSERKLDDAERLLEKRSEQLESLRQAHRRRLQRLKGLLTSYRLMKEQLRIAEEELRRPPKKKMTIKRPPASELQKETNGDAAWNELNYFKAENKNLVIAKMNLEEEVDDLRVRVADEAAASHELAVQLAKEREELKQLLRREAARQGSVPTRDMRAEMQSLLTRLQESDARVEDLKACLSELSTGNEVLEENCRRLKAEASSLRRDVIRKKLVIKGLNRKVDKLRHLVRSNLCRIPRWKRCTGSGSGEDDLNMHSLRDGRIRRHGDQSLVTDVGEEAEEADPGVIRHQRASKNGYRHEHPELDDVDSGSVSSAPHFSTPVAKKYERTLRRSLRKLSAAFQGQEDGVTTTAQSDDGCDSIVLLPDLGAARRLHPPVASAGCSTTHSENSDSTTVMGFTGDPCSNQPPTTSRSSDAESLGRAIARTAAAATSAIGSQTSPNLGSAYVTHERRPDANEAHQIYNPATAKECRSTGTSPIRAALAVPRRSILVRPARSMLYHVSSMKQRLLSLQRQIHVLSESKAACLAEAADLRRQCESLQQELSSTNQRCQLLKQANQKLQSELCALQSNYQLLQDGSPGADAVEKVTAELRAVESRLRASASEVTRQGTALKALKTENEQLREEVKDAQDKAGRLERDNAQKKSLLDDLRLKLSVAKESVRSEMATLEQKADEYNKLKLSLERLRTTNQSTKAQLTAVTKERHDYENLYVAARDEAERAARQLAASQARCAELQSALAELEAAAKEQLVALAEQGEAAVEATQRQLLGVHRRSEQLASFLTDLSAELLLRGERMRMVRRTRDLRERKHKLQEKGECEESEALRQAKSQAQRILEISADDLDDLMNVCDEDDEEEEGSFLGSDEEEGDKRKQMSDVLWMKKWQTLLGSKDNFSKELTDLFVRKVDELIEIN